MSNSLIDRCPRATAFLEAARVPHTLQPQKFGDWQIDRPFLPEHRRGGMPWSDFTLLRHGIFPKIDYSNMHIADDDGRILDVVMEDSPRELARHLPIWLHAHGHVLKTGLGLGCVVRGLLANPEVTHIDVVEIDADIIRVVGAEFACNPRVTIHQGDAHELSFPSDTRWDFAWHDIWTEENKGLHQQHMKLFVKFDKQADRQGAWQMPREIKELSARKGFHLLGSARAA